MTSGYRTTYWVLFIFMVYSSITLLSKGGYVYPGGFGIAIIFALIKDSSLKKRATLSEHKNTAIQATGKDISEPITIASTPSKPLTNPNYEVDEEQIYTQIAEEIETGMTDKGLWTRLFAECEGDQIQIKVLYIKQRANRLIAAERLRLTQLKHEHAVELEKAESLRQPATESQQMVELGITFDGEYYIYSEYKYDRLSDAINYAKLHRAGSL